MAATSAVQFGGREGNAMLFRNYHGSGRLRRRPWREEKVYSMTAVIAQTAGGVAYAAWINRAHFNARRFAMWLMPIVCSVL